jgi:Rne/Rng family ribonuclease
MATPSYSLFIDHIPGETRAVILKDRNLHAVHINRDGFGYGDQAVEGEVYRGRIVNVVPSLQAAFVDLGVGENGFLPVSATSADDISKAVHEGQEILVQVKKTARENKGPGLTTKIDLTGPDCVLTPGRPGINISRKFKDETRRETLKAILSDILPDDTGLVLRTSAEDVDPVNLKEQALSLFTQWQSITESKDKAPCPLYGQATFLERLWDTHANLQFDQVCVEGLEAIQSMKHLCPITEPHTAPQALFELEGISDQLEELTHSVVPLENGGDIHIERTTALIAIDVNSAERLGSRDTQDNAYQANLAALSKIEEHIRLRNLSGQIVVDFITMKNQSQRDKLQTQVQKAFATDSRTHVHGPTRMGLWELSRQHKGQSLDELLSSDDAKLCKLARDLKSQSGQITVKLGSKLFRLWQAPRHHKTTHWVAEQLGPGLNLKEDTSLPANAYNIEKG